MESREEKGRNGDTVGKRREMSCGSDVADCASGVTQRPHVKVRLSREREAGLFSALRTDTWV